MHLLRRPHQPVDTRRLYTRQPGSKRRVHAEIAHGISVRKESLVMVQRDERHVPPYDCGQRAIQRLPSVDIHLVFGAPDQGIDLRVHIPHILNAIAGHGIRVKKIGIARLKIARLDAHVKIASFQQFPVGAGLLYQNSDRHASVSKNVLHNLGNLHIGKALKHSAMQQKYQRTIPQRKCPVIGNAAGRVFIAHPLCRQRRIRRTGGYSRAIIQQPHNALAVDSTGQPQSRPHVGKWKPAAVKK